MTAHFVVEFDRVVRADFGAEAVLQRGDDPAAVGVVLRVGGGHHQDVQRQPEHVAADLDVAFLHDVEHGDLDPLGEVREFVDGHDAAVGARNQAVVDGLRVAQAAALGHPHGVDVADQVRDGGVRRRELFHIAFRAVAPGHAQPVPLGKRQGAGVRGEGFVGVFVQFRVLDHRRPLVQQPGQGAQQAGLALARARRAAPCHARRSGPARAAAARSGRSRRCRATDRGPPRARQGGCHGFPGAGPCGRGRRRAVHQQ